MKAVGEGGIWYGDIIIIGADCSGTPEGDNWMGDIVTGGATDHCPPSPFLLNVIGGNLGGVMGTDH